MAEWAGRYGLAIWAYCLMPNHVHLIAVPAIVAGFAAAIGEVHRRYTCTINLRQQWTGHLWQGRFASFPLEGDHLLNAVRYVERNPVRAGLVESPADWPWSSAAAHLLGAPDPVLTREPLASLIDDWPAFLAIDPDAATLDALRRHSHTGRPLGSEAFVQRVEAQTGMTLRPQKRGRPRNEVGREKGMQT